MVDAALPHLMKAAEDGLRHVADIVNISSIAGRVAWNGYGVYSMTKFGVNGFTEAQRQEVTKRHVRVGVLEPGGVATELGSHNKGAVREEIDFFKETTECWLPRTSPTGSRTWSLGRATPQSVSSGSCPLTGTNGRSDMGMNARRTVWRGRGRGREAWWKGFHIWAPCH